MASTFNPIKREADIPRLSLFQSRPAPEPGTALVLFSEGRDLFTLWPEKGRMTAGEVRWGRYTKAYHVDVSDHTFEFNSTLPCKSDAFDFHAEAQITCAVSDPETIVARRTTDARAILQPLVEETMRQESRSYNVEESEEAERAIADEVLRADYDTGFKIKRCVLHLRLEEEARTHIRKLKQIERDKTLVRRQAEFEQEKVALEAKLEKERDKHERERIQLKMEFYGPLIQQGEWQLLAFQLSNHPEDVGTIIQIINEERQVEFERQLRALKLMLDEDALEALHLEDTGMKVLRNLVDRLGTDGTRVLSVSDEEADNDDNGEGDSVENQSETS